jgi:hypothetical protein
VDAMAVHVFFLFWGLLGVPMFANFITPPWNRAITAHVFGYISQFYLDCWTMIKMWSRGCSTNVFCSELRRIDLTSVVFVRTKTNELLFSILFVVVDKSNLFSVRKIVICSVVSILRRSRYTSVFSYDVSRHSCFCWPTLYLIRLVSSNVVLSFLDRLV